jgi:hypothetical protein
LTRFFSDDAPFLFALPNTILWKISTRRWRLYAELPGRSGTAMTLGNVFGLVHDLFPLALGAFAERFGLSAMMWVLLAGPLGVLAGLLTVREEKANEAMTSTRP